MDGGIGIASGLAELIVVSAQITQLIYGYVQDVRHASRTQKAYLSEVSTLTDVLLRFEDVLNNVQTHAPTAASQPQPHLIRECHEKLDQQRATLRGNISKFVWPFEAKELKKAIKELHTFRSIFADHVAARTFWLASTTLDEMNLMKQKQDRATVLQTLQGGDLFSKARPDFLAGTGTWLLQDSRFESWAESIPTSILWCYGAPGVGKSSLVSMIIAYLMQENGGKSSSVLYHFCSFANRKQDDETAILRDLLRQLVEQAQSDTVSFLFEKRHSITMSSSLKEIAGVFAHLPLTGPIYIVIDGLDEIDATRQVLTQLIALVKLGFKVLVTSRDHPDIRAFFDETSSIKVEADQQDIKAFVFDRFQNSDFHDVIDKSHDLVDDTVSRASGLFILAKLLMDQILGATSIKQMRKRLANSPVTVFEAYKSSVKRIEALDTPSKELALRLISWIANAERALAPNEIIHAFALNPGEDTLDDEDLTPLSTLLRVCVSLVVLDKDTESLTLVHATAYDFFTATRDGVIMAHTDIANTCLHYLNLRLLRDEEVKKTSNMDQAVAQLPFLRYASRHWGRHVTKSRTEEQMSAQIRVLLDGDHVRENSFKAFYHQGNIRDRNLVSAVFDMIPQKNSALHIAAYWDFAYITKQLIDEGADVDAQNSQGWCPLHWAARNGHTGVIKILLDQGANPNIQDERGWTALFWSGFHCHMTDIELLLSNGAQSTIEDANGWTALHWAVSKGESESIKMLLDHHTQKYPTQPLFRVQRVGKKQPRYKWSREEPQRPSRPKPPIEIAADEGAIEAFEILLNAHLQGGKPDFDALWSTGFFDPPLGSAWRIVARSDRGPRPENYLSKESPGGTRQKTGGTETWRSRLVHSAIKDDQLASLRLMLELGAHPNHTILLNSPLHAAARRKNPEFARQLLLHGADLSSRDQYDQTPLHIAVKFGFEETVKVMVEGGADVNAKRSSQIIRSQIIKAATPLMLAFGLSGAEEPMAQARDVIVNCLLSAGTDPKLLDSRGNSMLHLALENGMLDAMHKTIDVGVNINLQNEKGTAAIHLASKSCNVKMVKFLKDHGADLFVKNNMGRNCFHYLAIGSDLAHSTEELRQLFDLLYTSLGDAYLNARFSVNKEDNCGDYVILFRHTPLSSAIEYMNWQLSQIFIKSGAELPNETGILLERPVKALNLPVVQFLSRHGVSLSGQSAHGWDLTETATDWLRDAMAEDFVDPKHLDTVVQHLFELGRFDLDEPEKGPEKETLLHKAISKQNSEALVRVLLKHGSNPLLKNSRGLDALWKAVVNGNHATLPFFLHACSERLPRDHWIHLIPNPTDLGTNAIDTICAAIGESGQSNDILPAVTAAIGIRNIRLAFRLLDTGIDITTADQHGWTLLHHAVFQGCTEVVHEILDRNIPIDPVTTTWNSQYLRSYDIRVDEPWTGTPLHLALMTVQPDLVQKLLTLGAKPNIRTRPTSSRPDEVLNPFATIGSTALWIALHPRQSTWLCPGGLSESHLSMARMLLDHGAKVERAADLLYALDREKFSQFEDVWTRIEAELPHDQDRDRDRFPQLDDLWAHIESDNTATGTDTSSIDVSDHKEA